MAHTVMFAANVRRLRGLSTSLLYLIILGVVLESRLAFVPYKLRDYPDSKLLAWLATYGDYLRLTIMAVILVAVPVWMARACIGSSPKATTQWLNVASRMASLVILIVVSAIYRHITGASKDLQQAQDDVLTLPRLGLYIVLVSGAELCGLVPGPLLQRAGLLTDIALEVAT